MFWIFHTNPKFISNFLQQMSTLERKKKNFSFTRKFPFMKSRDNIDDTSEGERKYNKILNYQTDYDYHQEILFH